MSKESSRTLSRDRYSFMPFLIGYWILLPFLYLAYLFLESSKVNLSLRDFLNQQPLLTSMFLIALLTPIAAYFLVKMWYQSTEKSPALNFFLRAMAIQQLLVGNLLGVGLIFLSSRQLKKSPQVSTQREWILTLSVIIFQFGVSFFGLWVLI
ncbi:hypothetical protein [Vagococcus lutrae]|uniref:hypothetical protein n=1 Tax=Vagococcus lutrae TaxID=81947 RepID=UPI000F86267F|nr:hypothetical protein [Vagococcus lutrae]RST92079.1 hypothetical protein CBF33_05750 [Vagococcus lutrae]